MANGNPYIDPFGPPPDPNDPNAPLKLTQRPGVNELLNPTQAPSIYSPSNTPGGTPPVAAPGATAPQGLIQSTTQAPFPAPSPVPPVATFAPATGVAVPAGSTGYTATPYAVAPEGTVQKQIMDIVSADSPLMQQARQNAIQQMQARGLLNSSIAIGAGEQAVISQALPIAQADAAAYNAAATNTANAANAAAAFQASASNAAETLNAQLATSMNVTNANAANVALSQEAQAANNRALTLIDNNTKQALAVLSNQQQQLLQSNVNAANMFSQTVTAIANINVNPNLDARAKANAIQSQINLLNEGLRTTSYIAATDQQAVTGLNLSQFFAGGLVEAPPTNPVTGTGATAAPTPSALAGQIVAPGVGQGFDQNQVTQVGQSNGQMYGVLPDGKAVVLSQPDPNQVAQWVYV